MEYGYREIALEVNHKTGRLRVSHRENLFNLLREGYKIVSSVPIMSTGSGSPRTSYINFILQK